MPDIVPADLLALIRRIKTGDAAALQDLYDALCVPVHDQASRTLSHSRDIRAVVDATFVEAFWMSRFHAAADNDVLAWLLEITSRRAIERLRLPEWVQPRNDDEETRLALRRLLAPGTRQI